MMKYIEVVTAILMTAKEAEEKGYITVGRNVDDGYEVTYDNGYKYWCPKDVFKTRYHTIKKKDITKYL